MQPYRMLLALLCFTAPGLAAPHLVAAADEGAKVFEESCGPCHKAAIRSLDNKHLTREQWQEAVERMIDQGAEVPKAKKAELLDYLTLTHGPASTATDASKK